MQIRVTLVDASGRAVRTGMLPSEVAGPSNHLRWRSNNYSFFREDGDAHVLFKQNRHTLLSDWGEDVATEDS